MISREETFKCQKYAISVARNRLSVTRSATLTIKPKNAGTPNLQSVKCVKDGQAVKIKACTSCIKSGLVEKPVKKTFQAS